jgi:PAS domain S-box-containing protein
MKTLSKKLLVPHHLEYLALDRDFLMQEASPNVQRFAYSDEIVVGNDVRIPFPELVGTEEILIDIFEGRLPNFDLKSMTRVLENNLRLYFDMYIVEFKDDENNQRLIIFFEDVTDRMGLEQTLVQATNEMNILLSTLASTNKYVEKIITSMAEVLLVTTGTGKIIKVNQAAENLLGYSESELVGRHINAIAEVGESLHTLSQQSQLSQTKGEVICTAKTGEKLTVAFSCTAIPSDIQSLSDSRIGLQDFLYIGRDITDRKRASKRKVAQYVTTRILSASETTQKAIAAILPVICDSLGWDTAELWMPEIGEKLLSGTKREIPISDPNLLRCVASWTKRSVSIPKFAAVAQQMTCAKGEGLAGHVWANGSPQWIGNVVESDIFIRREIAHEEGLHGAFGFPILGDYEHEMSTRSVLGVMTFFSLEVQSFDEELLQAMATIGSQIGQFIKRKQAEAALREEQEKSEKLLLNILPKPIAERLKQNETTIAEYFPEVTVLFADLVGFTSFSTTMSPIELVELLNQIFSGFDLICERLGLEKIKTIGDAYMAVGGLPEPRVDHAEAIAQMALDLQTEIARFNAKNNQSFSIRIGIHSGPVVAGVIGIKKFIYDLWGDTVNIASRMESHGLPWRIQVSEATYKLLEHKYLFDERGTIDVKGKGAMITYLLIGKKSA